MLRQSLALLVAYAVLLLGVCPELSAQEQYPPQPQYPQQQDPQLQQPPPVNQSQSGVWNEQPPMPQQPYPGPGQAPQGPYAQQAPQGEEAGGIDIAGSEQHGVARLSVVQGEVNVKRGDTGELVAAARNAPVVANDRVQTTPGSRTEVELDYANIVRVGPDTDLGFPTLQHHRYQLQLGAGTVICRVIRTGTSTVEIDTPSVGVHPTTEGVYRMLVTPDGVTHIAVRLGSAEVFSPRGTQQLSAGQTMDVRGDPANPEFVTGQPIAQDQFEDWSIDRDRQLLQSQSYQHVNPEISGAEDLDAYGSWVPSQYGQVWAPRPPSADWSPYSDGHWAYTDDYYGWTWVGNEPWGWAPYHYGRWFQNGSYGWSWWPGAGRASFYWSPACVGFFGFGLAAGLAAGIGWVALAPFELFHPWWGHGFGYGGRFGVGFGFGGGFRGGIGGYYRNAGFRGGALTARFGDFGSHFGRFQAASREQLNGASAFRGGSLPIRPTQASYHFANRQAVGNAHLNAVAGRSFFQRSGAAVRSGAANSFASRGFQPQQGVQQRGVQQRGIQQHGVAPNLAGRSGATGTQAGAGGWQHFGTPGSTGGYRQGFSSGAGANQQGGWHSFGRPEGSGRPATGASPYAGSAYSSRPGGGPYAPARPSTGQSYGGGAYNGQGYGRSLSYSQPRGGQSYGGGAPHYSAPSGGGSPHYSAPHYSAPSGGGHPSGGGGGGHSSGGGGGGHSGGGGGGHSGGGGGHHH